MEKTRRLWEGGTNPQRSSGRAKKKDTHTHTDTHGHTQINICKDISAKQQVRTGSYKNLRTFIEHLFGVRHSCFKGENTALRG